MKKYNRQLENILKNIEYLTVVYRNKEFLPVIE